MYDHSGPGSFLELSLADEGFVVRETGWKGWGIGEELLVGEQFSPFSMSESWLERTSWRQMNEEGL